MSSDQRTRSPAAWSRATRHRGQTGGFIPWTRCCLPPRLFVLGLQHLFIMYAGAVAVPLIVGGALKLPISTIGLLVNADLFVSGVATIIQSVGIGQDLRGAAAGGSRRHIPPCSAR